MTGIGHMTNPPDSLKSDKKRGFPQRKALLPLLGLDTVSRRPLGHVNAVFLFNNRF